MTGDYTLTLPVMLAVAIAAATSRALSYGTIYTTKLLRRGCDIDRGRQEQAWSTRGSALQEIANEADALPAQTAQTHGVTVQAHRPTNQAHGPTAQTHRPTAQAQRPTAQAHKSTAQAPPPSAAHPAPRLSGTRDHCSHPGSGAEEGRADDRRH